MTLLFNSNDDRSEQMNNSKWLVMAGAGIGKSCGQVQDEQNLYTVQDSKIQVLVNH